MIVNTILILLATATSGVICYFTGTYTTWWWVLIFVLFIPILYIIWFGIYLIPLWIASLFMNIKIKKGKPQPENGSKICYWFVRQTSYVVPFLFRIHFTRSGEFPKEKSMIVSNHTSNFDPMPILYYTKGQPVTCVTKPGNLTMPIAGPFIYNCNFIEIDRDNDFNAVKSIVRASKALSKNIASVYICPEGTRNHHPENGLMDFKGGSFKIEFKAKCPITVVAIKNTHKVGKQFWYRNTRVFVDVCEVIPYEKYKDMNSQELAHYCKHLIEKKLAERG